MDEKRVLHIYSSWTAGGAEKLMLSLAAALEQKGIKNFIAAPGDSYMFQKAAELGLKAYSLVIKGSFDPIGICGLAWIIRKEQINILHAHQGKVFWPCVMMKLFFGKRLKIVFHRHAQLPHRFYSRAHYKFADGVIAISKAVAQGLIEVDKVPAEKVKIVYNGTDFSRFNRNVSADEVKDKYGLQGKLVVGTVAAMNRPKGKGQEYLIEAAQIVKIRYPQIRFLIVGTGEIEDDLKRIAKKLAVQNEIVFTGYQEEVEKFIAAMDIFCFLSWDTEGFGQVMVEAQGMGKPVIGTNIGGIPETFKDYETGMLIPSKNSELLAQVIITMLSNKELLLNMGKKAEAFALENFSLDKMAIGVMKVYNDITGESNGQA
jgi:glycosyltransferase involved in cell wall biosynthesis